MSDQDNDEDFGVRRSANSSRPGGTSRTQVGFHHDGIMKKQRDATTQVSQKIRVSSALKRLKAKQKCPTDMEALPDPAFGPEILQNKDDCFRPKSANSVLQYADVPIQITQHRLGRPTRATILRNLKRCQSASSVCSDFSWIQDNKRLCNIHDYYRLFKAENMSCDTPNGESIHSYLTGARFNSAHWLDSHSLKTKGLYINKQDLKNVFLVPKPPVIRNKETKQYGTRRNRELLEVKGKGLMKDACVNTEDNYLSMKQWHGAEWQRNLPEMYQPVEEKYNPYGSVVIRAKRVQSEYQDPMKVSSIRMNRSKSAH